MNIENVKQIFGCPAMGSGQPTTKKSMLPLLFVTLAIIGIVVYLKHREKQRQEAENNKN